MGRDRLGLAAGRAVNAPALALAAGACSCLLALSCHQGPVYTPAEVKECAAIEARYADAVVAACFDRYSFDECADVSGLKAKRLAEQKAAGCR